MSTFKIREISEIALLAALFQEVNFNSPLLLL